MTRLPATSELVTVALIRNAAGITSGMVATSLPSDNSVWTASGFVQVGPVVGGNPDMYYARRVAVVQLSCWANNLNSNKVPWGKANNLAELITGFIYANQDQANIKEELTLRPGFAKARVNSAHFLTEWRKITEQEGQYARYDADLQVTWVQTEATEL